MACEAAAQHQSLPGDLKKGGPISMEAALDGSICNYIIRCVTTPPTRMATPTQNPKRKKQKPGDFLCDFYGTPWDKQNFWARKLGGTLWGVPIFLPKNFVFPRGAVVLHRKYTGCFLHFGVLIQ